MKQVIPAYADIFDVLEDAVDQERDAERFYRQAAERTDDEDIKQFLLDLSAMEAEHYRQLTAKLEMLRLKKSSELETS